jgi:hypothetical protein
MGKLMKNENVKIRIRPMRRRKRKKNFELIHEP